MKAVFDTNILIDYLNGIEAAKIELDQYGLRLISVISFMEVMVGSKDDDEEKAIRGFLSTFEIVALTTEVANEAIKIRRKLKLKIPDAVVYASARTHGCILVTRNTKELKVEWPDIRVPYQI